MESVFSVELCSQFSAHSCIINEHVENPTKATITAESKNAFAYVLVSASSGLVET